MTDEKSPEDSPIFAVIALSLFPLAIYVDALVIARIVQWHLASLGVPHITTTQVAVLLLVRFIVRGSNGEKATESWGRMCVTSLFWITLSLVALGVGAVLR